MNFKHVKWKPYLAFCLLTLLGSTLNSAWAATLSPEQVNALFARIIDPVDISYTETLDALTELEGNIQQYPADIQMMFTRLWCWNQDNEDFQDYIAYANEALNRELFATNLAARADLTACRGFYASLDGDNDAAFQDFDTALDLARRANDPLLIADAYALMADLQSYQGDIARALTNYKNAAQYYNEAGNEYFGNDIRSSVANTLRRMGDFNNAETYLAQQLLYYRDKGDVLSEANVAIDYGILFLDKNEPESALVWLDRSIASVAGYLEKKPLQVDERLDAVAYLFKAEALGRLGRGLEAESALKQALAIQPEIEDDYNKATVSMVKAYIAGARGEFTDAITLAQTAADLFIEEGNDRLLIYALEQLAKFQAQTSDFKAAYSTMQTLSDTRSKFRSQVNDQLAERLKIEYNLAQKEYENKELTLRNENQRLELEAKKQLGRWQSVTLLLALILLLFLGNRVMVHVRSGAQLKALALTDPLTQLANRRAIESFAEQLYSRPAQTAEPVSVIAFDIDFFKKVNDTFGHDAGDTVIVNVARLAKSCLRTQDMLARFGGEEYLAILPDADINQAHAVAKRICDTIAQSEQTVNNQRVNVTVSIGVAQKRITDASPSQTIRRADTALYEAKNNGRNQVKRAVE